MILSRSLHALPFLMLGFLTAAVGTPSRAQNNAPPASAAPTEPGKRIIDLIRYDPRTQGPLMLVVPRNVRAEYDGNDADAARRRYAGITLSRFGEIMACSTLMDGSLTALVPRSMTTIVSDPPDPDPTAGMQAEERFRLLLGTLTPAQWRTIGGSTGIGAGDLTDEQKPIFAGLFPADSLTVATMEERPSEHQPGQTYWSGTGEQSTVPVCGVRLRLRRQVSIQFLDPREGWGNASSTPGEREDRHRFRTAEGEERSVGITNDWRLTGDPPEDAADGTRIAFGQTVVRVEQNRAKPGNLPLDAPALGVGMRLEGAEKTVGELITRCAKETRLPLVADKRIAAFTLAWRIAPGGQTASVASVLRLLCRSVTGTFRRLDPPNGAQPVYLLTDDRVGYGTRLARLYRWGQRAEEARETLLRKAKANAAKGDPLSHVRFAPDDPLALPPALDASLETAYRTTNAGGIAIPPAYLSPALRDAIAKSVQWWKDTSPHIKVDRMHVGAILTCDYVLPDGRAFETRWGRSAPDDYLRSVAKTKPVVTVAPVTPPPAPALPVPRSTPRRVCVLPLPVGSEAEPLLVLARRKGFTEVFFRVSLYDGQTPERLRKVVALGKTLGMGVGASAPWLKRGAGETVGSEDVNVVGDTGTRWITDEIERMTRRTNETAAELGVPVTLDKRMVHMFGLVAGYLSGWIVPDASLAREPLSNLLAVPDLSAFVLTDTAAPGWDREMTDSNDSLPGASLGCTPATRVACVRSEGFDPLDVYDASLRPPFTAPELHFGSENLTGAMTAFRVRENRRELAALLSMVVGRAVPIYVEEL